MHESVTCLEKRTPERCAFADFFQEELANEIRHAITLEIAIGDRRASDEAPATASEIDVADPETRPRRRNAVQLSAVAAFGGDHRARGNFAGDKGRFESDRVLVPAAGRLSEKFGRMTCTMAIDEMDTAPEKRVRPGR